MRFKNRGSIKWRLVLVAIVTSAVAQLAAGVLLTVYDNQVYKAQKLHEAVVEAQVLAESLSASLVFHDAKATQQYLDPLQDNPEITAAGAYGDDAKLVASFYRTDGAAARLPEKAPAAKQHFEDDHLQVSVPVTENGTVVVGSVYMLLGIEPLTSRLLHYGGIVLLSIGASLALAVPISMRLNAAISEPIRAIAAAASRISAGDLDVTVASTGRADEVGVLIETFEQMVAGLRQMTSEVASGAKMLAEMANAILATTTQASVGAADTAAAIGETSITMEEVKQTVRLSAEKAHQVSEGAQRTAQVARTGREAVEAVTEGMARIREQVEGVALSISRLSAQSQAIGEIIAAVNDLADQSNLLAVNAAIEAARAGEHGRGFAVVAQEMKNLADQSKQATAQVRTILGDIQKATSVAVSATEDSRKAAAVGVSQSAQAGESIRVLSESIELATRAAIQIAASSQQQLAGVSQVAVAMDSIKQASAQNAAGVKEIEAAAQSMTGLGEKLGALVQRYRTA
jgi:methyl-accepting chemotaxis protein